MKLFIIVLSLLCERYLPHALSYKREQWFITYKNWGERWFGASAFANLLFAVVPIPLLLTLVLMVAGGWLWGLVGFLINMFAFYYCLGPDNAFYPAHEKGDEQEAKQYLTQVNSSLFAVIVLFVVTGAIGALFYRLLQLVSKQPATQAVAARYLAWIDWVMVRITGLFYLLAGNFQRGFSQYSQGFLSEATSQSNQAFLEQVAVTALREPGHADSLTLIAAQQLIERALVITLILIALFTLGAWL